MKVSILASAVDYGTRSISETYKQAIEPSSSLTLTRGFKKLKPADLLRVTSFLALNWLCRNTVLLMFNAPVLLGGLFPLPRFSRWVGFLEWNELLAPSGQHIPLFSFYDRIYKTAFRRLSGLYSPAPDFIKLYEGKGMAIQRCDCPLPAPHHAPFRPQLAPKTKVLFVGADYIRKGGDILLEEWARRRPSNATLTFVCPHPPEADIENVVFRRDIRAGTPEQQSLFLDHDIYVLPTRKDSYGFAILEALNSGMSVISSSEAGAAHVVSDFGGIVSATPEETVSALMEHLERREAIQAAREACQAYLPVYRNRVKQSLAEMLGTSRLGRDK